MSDQDQQQPAHEPMTAARLARIRARAEAATPGPWRAWHDTDEDSWHVLRAGDGQILFMSLGDIDSSDSADAEYVAATRQDVPDLLAFAEAALPILRAVAEAGVGDDVSGTWLMFAGYDADTVRDQARALLA